MRQHIPNTLTLINLACGVLSIIAVLNAEIEAAALLTLTALIMDFLDGFVARALGVSSPIGKELDSLADCVTFGANPGVMMMVLIKSAAPADAETIAFLGNLPLIALPALLIPMFSAYRLAKFNLDTRQSDCFYGLATPANTIFILSLALIKVWYPDAELTEAFTHPYLLLALCPILAYLLIAEIRLIAFKFKGFGWKGNEYKWSLIAVCVLLMAIFQGAALPALIPVYIAVSLLENLGKKEA